MIPRFSNPPSHPYEDLSQSTNYYSERSGVSAFPLALRNDSTPPTAENAQHDPHYPWSLTFVNEDQSAEAAGAPVGMYSSASSNLNDFLVK